MNIKKWLNNIKLGQYISLFVENDIDMELLSDITNTDLREIGISSLGHRTRIIKAINELKSDLEGKSTDKSTFDYSRFPSILAFPLQEYIEEVNPVLKLWAACDVVELLLRFIVIVEIAEIRQRGKLPKEDIQVLRSKIEIPTLGKWMGMATILVKSLKKQNSILPELENFLSDILIPFLNGYEKNKTVETSFLMVRNQLAHGSGVTKSVANKMLAIWKPQFEKVISSATWLGELLLIVRRTATDIGLLQGPILSPTACDSLEIKDRLLSLFCYESEVVVARKNTLISLWPFTLYGLPKNPHLEIRHATKQVPQVYVRRGKVSLQYTPLGSDELCQSETDISALREFLRLFRFQDKPNTSKAKPFKVKDFFNDIQKDSNLLIGRTAELSMIQDRVIEKSSGVFWLTGTAGIGKSYIISRIAAKLLESPPPNTLVLLYRFKAGDPRCSRQEFMQFTMERLMAWDKLEYKKCQISKNAKPLLQIKLLLENIGENRVIFIIDGLDEISTHDSTFAEEIPLQLIFPGVSWLCAGRPELDLQKVFSEDRCDIIFPDGVPPMSKGDIRTMLIERIGPIRKKLLINDREDGNTIINPFIDRVAEHAHGLPIYVTYVIGDILSNRYSVLDERENLPPSLEAYHETLINRYSIGSLNQVITPIVTALSIAREPMSVSAINQLLGERGIVTKDERGENIVIRALGIISTLIKRTRSAFGTDVYTLFHHSLRQHILNSESTLMAVDTSKHAFNNIFLKNLKKIKESKLIPGVDFFYYLIIWGIYHLIENNEMDGVAEVLNDEEYIVYRTDNLGFDKGMRLYFNELIELNKFDKNLVKTLLVKPSFLTTFTENCRYLLDSGLFIELRELEFDKLLLRRNQDFSIENQIAILFYLYCIENFKQVVLEANKIIKSTLYDKLQIGQQYELFEFLGMSYRKLADFDASMFAFEESVKLADKVKDYHLLSMGFMNIAKIEYHRLDFKGALKNNQIGINYLNKAIDKNKNVEDDKHHLLKSFLAEYYRLNAETLQWKYDLNKAHENLEKAKRIYQEINIRDSYYVRWFYSSAFNKVLNCEYESAAKLLDDARKLARNVYDEGRITFILAALFYFKGLYEKGNPILIQKALTHAEDSKKLFLSINSLIEYWEVLILENFISFHLQQNEQNEKLLLKVPNVTDKITWLKYVSEFYMHFISMINGTVHDIDWQLL